MVSHTAPLFILISLSLFWHLYKFSSLCLYTLLILCLTFKQWHILSLDTHCGPVISMLMTLILFLASWRNVKIYPFFQLNFVTEPLRVSSKVFHSTGFIGLTISIKNLWIKAEWTGSEDHLQRPEKNSAGSMNEKKISNIGVRVPLMSYLWISCQNGTDVIWTWSTFTRLLAQHGEEVCCYIWAFFVENENVMANKKKACDNFNAICLRCPW